MSAGYSEEDILQRDERIEELEQERDRALAEIASLRMCSTCCGTPHASGLPCICGGTNSREEEVKGLRLESTVLRDAVVRMGGEINALKDKGRYIQARIESWERGFERDGGTVNVEMLQPLWSQIYATLDVAFRPNRSEAEIQEALDAWRALTEEQREDALGLQFQTAPETTISYDDYMAAKQIMLRLLKAAGR